MFRAYSCLCDQGLLLAGLRGPYGVLELEHGFAVHKANALTLAQGDVCVRY